MNKLKSQEARKSPFTRPVFWIAFAIVSLGCAVFAFSNAAGLEAVEHIYVSDKGNYYELVDDLPKVPGHH